MTRSKHETMCGTCLGVVAVRTTPFNKERPSDVVFKTAQHKNSWGDRCPGSLLAVPAGAAVATA